MSPLRSKAPRSREKRLDTLGAWLGPVSNASEEFAAEEVFQRIRTFAQSSHDDLLYALRIVSGIKDSVTIIHGPRGCAAAGLYHIAAGSSTRWIVTNLDERDTIMGADAKLRKAVTALHHRYHPAVIFIVGNPVVAINNDDIQSVVEELHEELDVPIVPIYTTGFSTQNAVSGYDTALHALLKYLSGKSSAAAKNGPVNLLSVAENALDRKEAHDLLEGVGLELNVLPDNSTVASFRAAITARASIPLCPDAPEYLGTILQEKYGVPYIDAPRPVGIEGTGRWLKSIAATLDIVSAADELHNRKASETLQQLSGFSLTGEKVYLSLSSANAFSLVSLVEELGGEVSGVTVTHLDRLHVRYLNELAARNPALQIHVSDGQEFEEISILRKLSLDLYLGDSTHIGQVARLGIPTVSLENLAIVGYSGVVRLARRIKTALLNRSFGTSLARSNPPYRESWYRRSDNWHIKQEVK
ncbi:nitrogenase iron-molybdenum cofactor biosynthesis protein NifE [Geobacter sp. OR-1]|uniref:nitrogenase component 1 n=1 Tax=Geobacter sp. OR-1 TaxID=1266765 RepID=UPI0005423B61|nr:nitrogenase component 1 [Geobacter sp. OR-1]GAM10276.1 nitrogenase iron-molybdenum cofactor biosynthesis protein NifE [Geobacter sp. OR-1]